MESFIELAKKRYSVRKYKDLPVESEKLTAILNAGLVAPTACNYQPEKIYAVKSADMRAKLAEVCDCTFGAPVVFVICYDTEIAAKGRVKENYNFGETDAAIVTTHMMLEAADLGLGSCYVGRFVAKEIQNVLNLPEHIFPAALLPVGYAADDAAPAPLHESFRDPETIVTEL